MNSHLVHVPQRNEHFGGFPLIFGIGNETTKIKLFTHEKNGSINFHSVHDCPTDNGAEKVDFRYCPGKIDQ